MCDGLKNHQEKGPPSKRKSVIPHIPAYHLLLIETYPSSEAGVARNRAANLYPQGPLQLQIADLELAGMNEARPGVHFEDLLQPPELHNLFDATQRVHPQMDSMGGTIGIFSESSPPFSLDAFDIPEAMWSAFDLDFSMPGFLK